MSAVLMLSCRNSLSKKLTETQDEIADLKGKLRMLNHQFDQVNIFNSMFHLNPTNDPKEHLL